MDVDLRFSHSLHTIELHRHMAPCGIDVLQLKLSPDSCRRLYTPMITHQTPGEAAAGSILSEIPSVPSFVLNLHGDHAHAVACPSHYSRNDANAETAR